MVFCLFSVKQLHFCFNFCITFCVNLTRQIDKTVFYKIWWTQKAHFFYLVDSLIFKPGIVPGNSCVIEELFPSFLLSFHSKRLPTIAKDSLNCFPFFLLQICCFLNEKHCFHDYKIYINRPLSTWFTLAFTNKDKMNSKSNTQEVTLKRIYIYIYITKATKM